MKILVHELGEEEFRRQVEEEFQTFLALGTDFPQAEYDRIAEYFTPPPFETGLSEDIDRSDPDFDLWVERQVRSEEHTSELQSLMRNSYAVFCLNKKRKQLITTQTIFVQSTIKIL